MCNDTLAQNVKSKKHNKQQSSIKLFDGKPKTFVVNGYSTSFDWPQVLQRKLDKYFKGKRVIEVKSATQGSTPIAKWMNLETSQPESPWKEKLQPLLKNKKQPTIVLAQQSLQWALGSRREGINSAKDLKNIRKGSTAIKKYADLLLKDGADEVFIAMHIYKKNMEPQIGNERLALAEFLKSKPKHVHSGPDVWKPTSTVWPMAFQTDKVHPNDTGAEIIAHYWFAALLQHDDLKIPDWSEQEMKKAIANPPKQQANNRKQGGRGNIGKRILHRYDKNNDGKVTKKEFQGPERMFQRFDKNSDDVLSPEELSNPFGKRKK